jgi:L-seryl-tRNA(Ser) seleniumtransferase
MGFDLVTFSGGKGLRGPQCSGLLLGRKDLVEAAKLNGSPFGGIGRGMKVGKEEIMGLLTAVEVFLKADHEAQRTEFSNRVKEIAEVLVEVKGVQTQTFVPEIANHVPHLAVEWDSQLIRLAPGDVVEALLSGDPSIEVAGSYMWGTHPPVKKEGITVSVWMLQPGEHQIVAQRLKEVLSA